MKGLFEILFGSPVAGMPDLDVYNIPNRPRRKVDVKPKTTTTGEVFEGREWKTNWESNTKFTSETHGTKVPATPQMVELDEYDQAYLSDVVGENWLKDAGRAKSMKWHWLHERSAAGIESYHTAEGKTQKGYSERTAASFIKAFYEADEAREKAGLTRQRASYSTTPPSETFEW